MKHVWTGGEFHTRNCWLIPSKTRHLVRREMAFVHKEYIRNMLNLSIVPVVQAEISAVKHVVPTPRRNLKLIEQKWGLKLPRKRTCEHPRRLDSVAYNILTDQTFKLVSRPCGALHLNLHQYRSFRLINRNHTARRPKSGVYAEVVCRK